MVPYFQSINAVEIQDECLNVDEGIDKDFNTGNQFLSLLVERDIKCRAYRSYYGSYTVFVQFSFGSLSSMPIT